MAEQTELALIETDKLALTFQEPDGVDGMLAVIDEYVRNQQNKTPDLSTVKGRKEIASLAYKIARSKTAWDEAGKNLNADLRERINVVDAERRKIRDRLDKLRAEVRKPLDDWEAAEEARVEALKARVERLRIAHTTLPDEATSDQIEALLARVEATEIDDTWAEFVADAARYKDQAIATLRSMIQHAKTREAEAAELERLRREAAEREEAERQRKEAEEAAARQAEIERQAREQAAREAEEKAEADRKAQAEKEAEWKRQLEEAERKAEAATQAERDRAAAERKAAEDARQKREADAAHRERIVSEIAEAVKSVSSKADANAVAEAIVSGKIPHVRVTF